MSRLHGVALQSDGLLLTMVTRSSPVMEAERVAEVGGWWSSETAGALVDVRVAAIQSGERREPGRAVLKKMERFSSILAPLSSRM